METVAALKGHLSTALEHCRGTDRSVVIGICEEAAIKSLTSCRQVKYE